LFACAVTSLAGQKPPLVIRGGSVFDSVSGKMQPDRTIVIEGERIKSVGPFQSVTPPEGAQTIDAHGKFLIPGLIDAHAHLVIHVGLPDGSSAINNPHLNGAELLPLFLANGVTSLRDAGDEIVAEAGVAYFARMHPERSPRVFLGSSLLDGDPPFHRYVGRALTDAAQVPAFVEDMAGWNVTTLKIYVGTDRLIGRKIIEEGHRHGLVVTAHLGKYSAQDAVVDGVDCLEHIWSVFNYIIPLEAQKLVFPRSDLDLENPKAKKLIGMLVARKVWVDPTLVVFRNMLLLPDTEAVYHHADNLRVPKRMLAYWHQYPNRSRLPLSTLEPRRRELQKYKDLVGILHRAGVPLLAGTDTPCPYVPPGFSMHQELELLVASGLPPAAALQAATIQGARVLKQDANLGSIEAGKLADLVILDADPLADIRNTRKINRVVRGGCVLDSNSLLQLVPTE
jgi:imidazolonepropionase-like amidohydrolase